MSGEHSILSEDCSDVICKQGSDFLLGTQYVEVLGLFAKVKVGSGMGEEHSGAMSDYCFYKRCEKYFLLSEIVREKYKIYCYVRYRDDFLVISSAPKELTREFCDELKKHAKPFLLEVESISSFSCTMLDLKISKGTRFHRCGIVDFGMHFKTTHQAVSLDERSHHAAAHHIWPLERFYAFCSRCSDSSGLRTAKLHLFEKLVSTQPSHSAVSVLAERLSTRRNYKPVFRVRPTLGGSWLVLPFHCTFQGSGLGAKLKALGKMYEGYGIERFAPRISWKLTDRPFFGLVATDAQSKCDKFLKWDAG